MFESVFIFDEKFYEQCNGVAMGSPLGSTLANAFMHHFGKHWVGKQSASFQNNFVIHDTFLIF